MDYGYAAEKFSTARHILMLPHPKGEEDSIASAFHEMSLGLHGADINSVDDVNSREWLKKLRQLMATDGLLDPEKKGLYALHAERLSVDQKYELSRLVDDLAYWLSMKSRGDL